MLFGIMRRCDGTLAAYLCLMAEPQSETVMAKRRRSFVKTAQRKVVGLARSTAARIEKVAVRAATAAAMAAAEAAVSSMMRSMSGAQAAGAGRRKRARKTAKKAVRRSAPKRKTVKRKKRI
jgi:hypothetical protein